MTEKEMRSVVELHQRSLDASVIKRKHVLSKTEIGHDDLIVLEVLAETEEYMREQIAKLKQEGMKK